MSCSRCAWRSLGVTYRIALWRCVPLYQSAKRATHRLADARSAKGSRGYAGVCFSVRNSASEYGLSSETCCRLKDGMTPSHCNVEIIVLPRMGAPLSECSTRPRGSTLPSMHTCRMSAAATSADSRSAMRHPTMRRLQTSMMRYRYKYDPRTVVGNQVMSQLQTWFGEWRGARCVRAARACVTQSASSSADRVDAASGTKSTRTRGTVPRRRVEARVAWARAPRSASSSARSPPAPPRRVLAHCLADAGVHSADRRARRRHANARWCEQRCQACNTHPRDARLPPELAR